MQLQKNAKNYILISASILAFFVATGSAVLYHGLKSPVAEARILEEPIQIEIERGDGMQEVVRRLDESGLLRSSTAFSAYLLITGDAFRIKPGLYHLDPSMRGERIARRLVAGAREEVRVTIHEGMSVYEIDPLLAREGVIQRGELIQYVEDEKLNGKLFPDTYRFFLNSSARDVALKMHAHFKEQTASVLASAVNVDEVLTLASLLEKEVPDHGEQRVVAGIFTTRQDIGMPLQVDATICYLKKRENPENGCYPITRLDLQIESRYNTYLHKGLPPGPIGNPGISAIRAALNPEPSDYLYYLSDPETGRTIFSETLDAHQENRVKYLLQPQI